MEYAVKKIMKEMPTPFYVFDEQGFMDNYRKLEQTFKAIYSNYRISYSYKTNYTPFICQLVKKMGGFAEVVSDMEYTLAKKIGYTNDQIVYNGPSKGPKMFEHIDNGGILNIDSLDEAKLIVAHSRKNPETLYRLGIRVNMDVGGDFISRFGLVPDSEDMIEVVRLIESMPNMKLVGVHCHISRARGLTAWAKRVETMLYVADKYVRGTPEYISLGSGMFADMADELKIQFGGENVPTYQDYAECTIRPIAEHYKECDKKPQLFTEPGTTVIARYLSFATKVLSIKEIRGRWIANMDGDFHNLGEICTMKKLPINIISGGGEQQIHPNMDIMGFTCLEQDVLYSGFEKPVAVGDVLVFGNVGGYSIVSKPQFIKPQSPMFALCTDGTIRLIMRAETFDDIFAKFVFEV